MKLFFILIPLSIMSTLFSMDRNSPTRMQIETYVSLHTGETVFAYAFKNLWGHIQRAARSGDYSQDVHISLFALCKEGKELPEHHKQTLKKHMLPTSVEEMDVHKRSIIMAAFASNNLLINPSDPQDLTCQFTLKQEDKH
ncbi:MAG TPA: hypothetical protein VHO47_05045 [Candidatus Babeliales bacterium]|nr:hypothetical protein [Candidatus Babeliales bacterium]